MNILKYTGRAMTCTELCSVMESVVSGSEKKFGRFAMPVYFKMWHIRHLVSNSKLPILRLFWHLVA